MARVVIDGIGYVPRANIMGISTESQARAEGMTREVIGRSFHQELNLLIAPESDLDELFTAYDLDAREIITVRGWLGVFEDV